jgi:hypothetical protein
VKNYLITLAMEMVRKYDIDAIHFDYIRYPEKDFNDADTYSKYGNGQNINDWRRENINKFVRELYDSIMLVKPMLKVGSAPIGNYKAGVPGVGAAWYGYTDVFQDSRRWMQEQKHDYLAPQIYWALNSKWPYHLILQDWLKYSYSRHIYGGVGAYVVSVYPQINKIIDTTRVLGGLGNVFYRYDDISSYSFAAVKNNYVYPANIPPMKWKDSIPPNPPTNLRITKISLNLFELTWDKPTKAVDGDDAKYYNVYRSTTPDISFNDGSNLRYITTPSETRYTDFFPSAPTQNYYYAVSSLDKGNVESSPSDILTLNVTGISIQEPVSFILHQNYPNPFNPSTIISYSIPQSGYVSIKIFNVLGKELLTLIDEFKEMGRYNIEFNASNMSSGIYYYQIQVLSPNNKVYKDIKKMILLR